MTVGPSVVFTICNFKLGRMSWWMTCYLNYMEICLILQSNPDTQPEILLVITKNIRGYHHKSAK